MVDTFLIFFWHVLTLAIFLFPVSSWVQVTSTIYMCWCSTTHTLSAIIETCNFWCFMDNSSKVGLVFP